MRMHPIVRIFAMPPCKVILRPEIHKRSREIGMKHWRVGSLSE